MKNLKLKITLTSFKVILIPIIREKELAEYSPRFFAFAQNDRLEFLIRKAL